MIQSWAQCNQTWIEIMDQKIEQMLKEIKVNYIREAEGDKAVTESNTTEHIREVSMDFKVEQVHKTERIVIESEDEDKTQGDDWKTKDEENDEYQTSREDTRGNETNVINKEEGLRKNIKQEKGKQETGNTGANMEEDKRIEKVHAFIRKERKEER